MKRLAIGLSSNKIEPCYTSGRIDGIGTYTEQLMHALRHCACATTAFFYPAMPHKFYRSSRKPRVANTIGMALPLPYIAQSFISEVFHQPVKLRQHVDLFHATDYYITRMDVPIVATLHDAVPLKYPQWTTARLRRLKNWLMRRSAKLVDWIIAPSEFVINDLVAYFGVDAKRISAIPCGVHQQWLTAPNQDEMNKVLQRHMLTPGYFLFVGTLQPRKNIQRILSAYLKLPAPVRIQQSLVIVGRPGWRCADDIAAIRAAQADGEQVHWLANVISTDELRCLYAGAGVFILPSLYEGFGMPILEAFAARVPVVTANTTALHEVSAGAAIEVNPESIKAIAEGMLALVEDAHLAARCIDLGYARARQYTWQRTAELTAAVYRRLV